MLTSTMLDRIAPPTRRSTQSDPAPLSIVSVRVWGEVLPCRVDRLLSGRLEATLLSMPVSPVNRATWIVGDGLVFLKQHVVTVHA